LSSTLVKKSPFYWGAAEAAPQWHDINITLFRNNTECITDICLSAVRAPTTPRGRLPRTNLLPIIPVDMDYLNDLNPEQYRAVTTIHGPLLILAGAGSGKTRALTYRLAYIADHLNTRNILAVTFTNKAAREMLKRTENLLGAKAEGLWVCTFHALGNRILRREIGRLGRESNFAILDEQDQAGLIRQCTKELNLDPSTWPPKYVQYYIENAKSALVGPEEMEERSRGLKEKGAAKIYNHYEKRLVETGSVDFNDLLGLTYRLLSENRDIREKYSNKFRFILIDEFQDTNRVQYELMRLLVGPEQNICVVGDEDQSIYRWRGADIRNILGFRRDFPKAELIRLEKNYRSVSTVLDAAGAVISRNRDRIGKKLVAVRGKGEPIVHFAARDELAEAAYVAEKSAELVNRGFSWGDISVFYRTHAQSRAFEDAFRRRNIPYLIIGGVRFYERKEIKDALAYLRLAINPKDDISFQRIINVPPRKIGDATVSRLRNFAAERGVSLLEACPMKATGLAASKQKALGEFAELISSIAGEIQNNGPMEAVETALEMSGYRAWLQEKGGIEQLGKLENLDELLRAAEEYESSNPEGGIEGFLDSASLLSDFDTTPSDLGSVTLMTLHTAKGLEFVAVFLVGMEDGVFPHQLCKADPAAMEEERRLCYVGMTRAKDFLFLTRAVTRRLRGKEQFNQPSPYLEDIPRELVRTEGVTEPPRLSATEYGETDIHYDEPEFPLRPGRRVRHPDFGPGIVESVEGKGENIKVKVYFHSAGHKTLALKYTHLEPA